MNPTPPSGGFSTAKRWRVFNRKMTNWQAGDAVPQDQIYSDPPPASDPSILNLYGYRYGDPGHRAYSIPADTPLSHVVRVFKVGSRSSESYGDDATATTDLVAKKADDISALVPCRVIFADPAGLKLRFDQQITSDDLSKIEALFPEDEAMQAGLERYAIEWDGESSLLAPVLSENMIHLWRD